ncbi:MAG: hypothetical protein HY781_06905 [Chloroflexi bacterium]|nr:hypothetical protein [Chloroflexota bacterium]
MNRFLKFSTLVLACLLIVSCEVPDLQIPIETPMPTATLTPVQPTPTLTPTATPVPSGPCDNPLMSLNVGNQWKYRSTSQLGSSEQILRVTEWNEEVGINAVIEMEDLETGTIDGDWVTCLGGGGIEDFPLFFISLQMGDYMDGVLNTFYQSGIYAPAYAELAASNWHLDWDAEYLTEESLCFTNVVENVTMCINSSSPIDLTFETQGEYESVTVPAGTFSQALKVTFTFRMATTLVYPTLATSAPLTVTTTQWYAPFIGLVRSQVDSASLEILPGQESAAPVESVVELIEYTVAP